MAYVDRSWRNWGALVGTAVAVPAAAAWTLIEFVGGALVCESVDGPCGPSLIDWLLGLTAIAVVAFGVGWIFNRAIDLIRSVH
ncbi:hypothetical protein [Sphingomonas sp. MMS24-J13]|uniref:hypothetical protein n=1 Tax=Sphingomonas sp. MMS24-J13 TaxID=3238686 RepID=UPI00384C2A56